MPPQPLTITAVSDLPEDLARLVQAAEADGFGALARLEQEWASGENRFDAPGEALLVARQGDTLVGVCGLNLDPFLEARDRAGRVRRLFVHPEARRLGVGRALVEAIIGRARPAFATLGLRTHAEVADAFYRALGFAPVASSETLTHRLTL